MAHTYMNHGQLMPNFDEARYQTIGRGHGFAELNGVPFKIAEKYAYLTGQSEFTTLMESLRISSTASLLAEADSYTFDLERKVIENMEVKGS